MLILILWDQRNYGISRFPKVEGTAQAGKYERAEKPRFPKGGGKITVGKHESIVSSSKIFAVNKKHQERLILLAQLFHTYVKKW